MITVDYCVCCNSKNIKLGPARLSHFVIDRMIGSEEKKIGQLLSCNYIKCLDCDFIFNSVRFNQDEEFQYYKNYMQDEYITHRCEYESPERAEFYKGFKTDEYKNSRKNNTYQHLLKALSVEEIDTIKKVLDFGGDTGDLIPDDLGDVNKYVLDVEPRISASGVTFVSSPDECGKVDLVISSHTFEHVSYPVDVIKELKKYLKPNGYFIIEVPKEYPDLVDNRDFHEHINLWSETSLVNFLESNGFCNCSTFTLIYHKLIGNVIIVVCQLK